MMEALLISNVVLWICVVALSIVVWALVRQLGVLHERLAPMGALATTGGLEVGAPAPDLSTTTLDGKSITIGGADADGTSTLLFFLSPTCPVCKTLLPTVLRIAQEEGPKLRLVFASDGDAAAQRAFATKNGIEAFPYVLSKELGLAYHVEKLPYAVLIDSAGTVRAKGLVNTREHVESLFSARDEGVASIQDYLARKNAKASGDPASTNEALPAPGRPR